MRARSTFTLSVTSRKVTIVPPSGSGWAAPSSTRLVGGLQPERLAFAVIKRRNDVADAGPGAALAMLGPAHGGHRIDMRAFAQRLRAQGPQAQEGLIVEPQTPVRAEHGDRFRKPVQRLALNADECCSGLPAPCARTCRRTGRSRAPSAVGGGNHAQHLPAGQVPPVVHGSRPRYDSRNCSRQRGNRPVGHLCGRAQALQHFALARAAGRESRFQIEQALIGRVVEVQPGRRGRR